MLISPNFLKNINFPEKTYSMILAAAGVGKLILADRDNLEESNLTRTTLFNNSDIGSPKVAAAKKRLLEKNPQPLSNNPEVNSMHIFKSAIQYSFKNTKLRKILLISVALQFLAQPLLHYWQPLFLSVKTDISGQDLGLIFSLYSGAIVLASYLIRKNNNISNGLLLLVWIFLYILIGQTHNFYAILALFCFQQMSYSILRVRYGAELIHSAPTHISVLSKAYTEILS